MWTRRLGWMEPVEAAAKLAALPRLAFLDSAMPHESEGRFSYVCADPFGVFHVGADGAARWNGEPAAGSPLATLRRLIQRFRLPPVAGLPPFQGGAVGTVAYEFGWTLEGRAKPHRSDEHDLDLAFYDVVLGFDHLEKCCWLMSSGLPDRDAGDARARAERFEALLLRPAAPPADAPTVAWRAETGRTAHEAAVDRVRDFILAGDIYQANVARRFAAPRPNGPAALDLYRRLRDANPAPYAAFLDLGTRQILSTSPELFLRCDGRHVETRPIKGTARREAAPAADLSAAAALAASAKNRAENIMIVDLLRNDLARVCEPASVAVPALCAVESYAGLHHLVSVVTGTLRPGTDALDLLAASFPGGSITGAPKLRAMEIIALVEGRARGAYCGSIGWFGFTGAMALNIAIRTVVATAETLEFRAGGGITLRSDPAEEFEETNVKAGRILAAFAGTPVPEPA